MADSDLLFSLSPGTSNLLFGETATAPSVTGTMSGAFPAMTAAVVANYKSETPRPTVRSTATAWELARQSPTGAQARASVALKHATERTQSWANARALRAAVTAVIPQRFDHTRIAVRSGEAEAVRVPAGNRASMFQDALRDRRTWRTARHQEAQTLRHARASTFQDCNRGARGWMRSRFTGTSGGVGRGFSWNQTSANPLPIIRGARHQEARRPPAGRWIPTVPEVPGDRCYTPSGKLLFFERADGTGSLLFVCEKVLPPSHTTVIVPVRSVYMVLNNVWLKRVAGNIDIPTLSMSLKIDADSWTWGFDATVPADALASLEPGSDGNPVELEASINGTAYRVLAEGLSRERVFGEATVRVTGRGKGAVLDTPYAHTMNFSNAVNRTAQQLMADVLTINGVAIGWDVDWRLTDWLVPAGAWSHQGSYISALKTIAGAAGAYLQPHRTVQAIRVVPRYPLPPWEWGSVIPDFELPSALTSREAIDWKDAARYNGVYVSGVSAGVLGFVRRTGTAGEILAPMVVDPLITEAAAARQRGIAVLADTGRQMEVSLHLPVLAETGIIEPGAFVSYRDGDVTRLGLVRSTSVQAGLPEVWQTLGVEAHA
ncbi:MAG: hypothetical protein IPP91_17610 [Betaproteobacteria bacterium]|nr:hypothetical protein [Betaproteobacteria bacterium]